MPRLNLFNHILAFGDTDSATNNPQMRYVDWRQSATGVSVEVPYSREYVIEPAGSITIFDGSRTLGIDGTTEFQLTLIESGVYRLTTTGGTAPAFRTARTILTATDDIVVEVNNNATVSFTLDSDLGHTFSNAQVGDTIFIPDTTTGDSASPFNVLNVGFWKIIGKSSNNLTLYCVRRQGETFEAVSETVTVAANSEFTVFSSGPVQVGDSLQISLGFSQVTWGTYQISEVTSGWVEFTSGKALPLEEDIIPTAAGLKIYGDARNFVYLEVDQEATVTLNGSVDVPVSPRLAGDETRRGMFMLWSTVWSLEVENKSPDASLTLTVITARSAE